MMEEALLGILQELDAAYLNVLIQLRRTYCAPTRARLLRRKALIARQQNGVLSAVESVHLLNYNLALYT
jgi:hypothetical protein